MKKITVIGGFNFTEDQILRLKALGEVSMVDDPDSADEWLQLVQGADVICSDGSFLLENLPKLKNVFVTYPYIELGPFDSEQLKQNGVMVANTRGSNRDSIVEWVMFMTLALFRKFPSVLRITEDVPLEFHQSLVGKNVLIVGKGSIGTQVGTVCGSFGMNVDFFKRGDDLLAKSKDTDLVVNALNCNSTSKNLLNKEFFMSLKPGAHFVSFVRQYTFDLDGLLEVLDSGVLAGAAIDCDPERPGNTSSDFYKKALSNEKILVTPHIAFATKQAKANGAETVIQNIEAFIAEETKNVVVKA